MSEEERKWLELIIKENKESDNSLKYTYCPFNILYSLQQENSQLKERIENAIEYANQSIKYPVSLNSYKLLEILKGDKNSGCN